jgi:hypothetical protein
MPRIEKTVFISYRRVDRWPALSIFKDLSQHGYDTFIDYDGIPSGDFESAIVDNIKARAHFIVVLTPTALEHCDDPSDWMRREIETALAAKRNIVPLLMDGFTLKAPLAVERLQGSLAPLRRYQALSVPKESLYFDTAMEQLRSKYLAVSVKTVLHPASQHAQQVAKEQHDAAVKASGVRGRDAVTDAGALYSVGDCAEEMIRLSSQVGADQDITIEGVGLDLSIACDYVAEVVRVCGAGRMTFKLLGMTNNATEVGPVAPDDVVNWASYVDGSVRRIVHNVRKAIRGRAPANQHFTASLRQYRGLPVLHGTMMNRGNGVTYCSVCRFRGDETYDWGERAYRRVVGGVGTPSDVHLAEALEGLFVYLWDKSKILWECEAQGNTIVHDVNPFGV